MWMIRFSDEDLVLVSYTLLFRASCIFLAIVANLIIPDHIPTGVETFPYAFSSIWTQLLLQPFMKWDAVHYLKIAMHGYEHDYQHVFFPLFPILLRFFDKIVSTGLPSWLGLQSFEVITACTLWLNLTLNCVAVLLLKKILLQLGYSRSIVTRACWYFVINPASIFFITTYTESMFAVLSWWAMYNCLTRPYHPVTMVPLFLASWTRSNGMFNIVIVGGIFVQDILRSSSFKVDYQTCWKFVITCMYCISSLFPYLFVCQAAHYHMCNERPYAQHQDFCNEENVWSTYSYLQHYYWQVGFLQYYQLKQIPNFLLAAPLLYFFCNYFASHLNKSVKWPSILDRSSIFFLHGVIISAIVLMMAHVQIIHRVVLSSSPIVYIILAVLSGQERQSFVSIYAYSYTILGIVLHCNNFPWT